MSYHGYPSYSGSYYPSSSSDQGEQHGVGRSSTVAPPALAAPAYPLVSGREQYAPAANSWSDQNQYGRGVPSSHFQSSDNTRWKDREVQQPTSSYQQSQGNYAMPTTSSSRDHSSWMGTTTQSQKLSNTQALSHLADASRASIQAQQFRQDPRATTHAVGTGQSPSYTYPYPISNARSSQAPQWNQNNNQFQQHLPTSAITTAFGGGTSRRNDSPVQQTSPSAQHYQLPTSTVTQEPNQVTRPLVQPQAQTRPISDIQKQQKQNMSRQNTVDRHETSGSSRDVYSNGTTFTLPPPQNHASEPDVSQVIAKQSNQSKTNEISLLNETHRNIISPPTNVNLELAYGAHRQQDQRPPPPVPNTIDASRPHNLAHQQQERQRTEERKRLQQAARATPDPNGGMKDGNAHTVPLAGTGPNSGDIGDRRQASNLVGGQQPNIRRLSEASQNSADFELGQADMAGDLKLMMQRMREWRTKDPTLFQKLWEDLKKGNGSGPQLTRGQTPTPQPHHAQIAQQVAKDPTPEASGPSKTHPHYPRTGPPITSKVQTVELSHSPVSHSHLSQPVPHNLAKPQIADMSQSPSLNQFSAHHTHTKEAPEPRLEGGLSMLAGSDKAGPAPVAAKLRGNKAETAPRQVKASDGSLISTLHTPSMTAAQHKQDQELEQAEKMQQTRQPHQDGAPPQETGLVQPSLSAPSYPASTGANSVEAAKQPFQPANSDGSTIWPESKRKALAEAAHKALLGLEQNKNVAITAAEINALLDQNPSYTELCGKLEARGLSFHRSQFARYLLSHVSNLSSPPSQPNAPQPAALSSTPLLQDPLPPTVLARASISQAITDPLSPNLSQPSGPSSAMGRNRSANIVSKAIPAPQAKPRMGMPSRNAAVPAPGSKAAKARKRDFSELVDMTQLSDDEHYAVPRKQARHTESPENDYAQVGSDLKPHPATLSTVVPQSSDLRGRPYGPPVSGSSKRPERPVAAKSDLQAHFVMQRPRPQAALQPSQTAAHKVRRVVAKPLNKAEASRKSYYNPKTIARDVLIAAGRHPTEEQLNFHLVGLLGKQIDNDSDLSTIDWESLDPGGPPMPVVQVVNIPAGPPRWTIGQRPLAQGPPTGTFDPPPQTKGGDGSKPRVRDTLQGGRAVGDQIREQASKELQRFREPHTYPSFSQLGSQTEALLQDSLSLAPPKPQPTPPPPSIRTSQQQKASLQKKLQQKELKRKEIQQKEQQQKEQQQKEQQQKEQQQKEQQQKEQQQKEQQQKEQQQKEQQQKEQQQKEVQRKEAQQNVSQHQQLQSQQALSVSGSSPNIVGSEDGISQQRIVGEMKNPETTPQPATSAPAAHITSSSSTSENPSTITSALDQARRSITMERVEASTPMTEQRRRGRPPGAKNKHPSAASGKKAAKPSNVEISVPTLQQSASPQYNIYACRWRKCGAELHNLPTLRKHIAKVHKVADDVIQSDGQPCWWLRCRTLEVTDDGIVPRVTFNSLSDWSDHVESDHLYPLGMKLGDGPSSSQTDPQTLARDRQTYLSDQDGRTVTAPSTESAIASYPADTLVLSSLTMNAESNIPNRAFSKAHGNDKMDIKQSAIETLLALQKHKEKVGPGLDRGGCILVNAEMRATLADSQGIARVVDADY